MAVDPTRATPREFRNWNEKMVRKFDPDAFHHHSNPIVRLIEQSRVKAIIDLINAQKDDPLLEIGCGAGNVIEKAPTGQLFGVDISSTILFKAYRRLKERVHLFQGDALNLPCKSHVFKKIICSEVLEHVLDPLALLKEMERVLETRGVAIVSVPNELLIDRIKTILTRLRIFRWVTSEERGYTEMPQRMGDEWHLHTLPLEQWLRLLQRCFKVTRVKRVPFAWLPIRYVIRLEKLT